MAFKYNKIFLINKKLIHTNKHQKDLEETLNILSNLFPTIPIVDYDLNL